MEYVMIFILRTLNLTFTVAGIELSLGSVILGTLLISLVCSGIRAMFD